MLMKPWSYSVSMYPQGVLFSLKLFSMYVFCMFECCVLTDVQMVRQQAVMRMTCWDQFQAPGMRWSIQCRFTVGRRCRISIQETTEPDTRFISFYLLTHTDCRDWWL